MPRRPEDRGTDRPEEPCPEVGLCSVCRLAVVQPNARGNVFWRCLAADRDDRLLRYPPLPVRRCAAHEPGRPQRR